MTIGAREARIDISGQMRNVARQMTTEEIELAAKYYSQR